MVPTILDTSPNTTSDPLEMVVAPEILRWVRDGVSISLDEWNRRFPFYEEWMSGDVKPVWVGSLRVVQRTRHSLSDISNGATT